MTEPTVYQRVLIDQLAGRVSRRDDAIVIIDTPTRLTGAVVRRPRNLSGGIRVYVHTAQTEYYYVLRDGACTLVGERAP